VVTNAGGGESDHRLLMMGLKVSGPSLILDGYKKNKVVVKTKKRGKFNFKELSRNNYAIANIIHEKLEIEMEKLKRKILFDLEAEVGPEYWKDIYTNSRTIVQELCELHIPRKQTKRKNDDWFDKNRAYLIKLIRNKNIAWGKFTSCIAKRLGFNVITERKKEWGSCRKLVRLECRRLRKMFWVDLAGDMQRAFDNNEKGLFFAQSRKLFGPIRSTSFLWSHEYSISIPTLTNIKWFK
jgi:hypothetical protein